MRTLSVFETLSAVRKVEQFYVVTLCQNSLRNFRFPLDMAANLWYCVVLKQEVKQMKILEDLYYGNIIPQEKTFIDDSR